MADTSAAGVALYFARGNRDFLCGEHFLRRTGARLLPDYAVIELNGERTLLMHGDLLCTRDVKYQRFRGIVHNRAVQRTFLALPLRLRRWIAGQTQSGTRASAQRKSPEIMDVDTNTVSDVMRKHDVTLLIHGHTHRPGTHELQIDKRPARRIVLGDWYGEPGLLACTQAAITISSVARFADYGIH